jgi:hypothetical protein
MASQKGAGSSTRATLAQDDKKRRALQQKRRRIGSEESLRESAAKSNLAVNSPAIARGRVRF